MKKKHNGSITLDNFSQASKFNKWMFEGVEKYIKGNVLEIGSGIGNMSSLLVKKSEKITLSDIDYRYVKFLKNKFGKNINIINLDVGKKRIRKDLENKFDTLVSFNVLEHIENDQKALKNIYNLLKNNGKVILLVPANKLLYCNLDKKLHHFRRYEKKELVNRLKKLNFEIEDCFYFNSPGVFGWWLAGKIERRKQIPKIYIKLFDFFVPVFRIIDKFFTKFFGLSLVIIGDKNEK